MKIGRCLLSMILGCLGIWVCRGEEYVQKEWRMREIPPVETLGEPAPGDADEVWNDKNGVETYFLSSAPVSDREYLTVLYEYADSVILSTDGCLVTLSKVGGDTVFLKSLQSRRLRLSPVADASGLSVSRHVPQRLETRAYAEVPGVDTTEVSMALSAVPCGRVTLVVDTDTLRGIYMTETVMSVSSGDSVAGSVVSERRCREWYADGGSFPIVRELTESVVAGGDTIESSPLTLLAVREEIEDAVVPVDDTPGDSGQKRMSGLTLRATSDGVEGLTVALGSMTVETEGTLRVYDVLGRQLTAPQQVTALPAGSEISLRLIAPLPGVYFVSFTCGSETQTIKIVD